MRFIRAWRIRRTAMPPDDALVVRVRRKEQRLGRVREKSQAAVRA